MDSLIKYYEVSYALVQNNEECSDVFRTTIGVKQGGPLSPTLFAIYIEDLIEEIEKEKLGPFINEIGVDLILYADDILLIGSTDKDIQVKIGIVEQFGHKNEIKFNPVKTFLLNFKANKKE